MKNLLLFTFSLFFSLSAMAESYQIVSMFEKDALVTHRLLSFKVKDSGGNALDVESVNVNIGCDAMIDIHFKNIFHIMCTEETKVQGSIYLSNGELVSLQTFTVRQLGKVFSFPTDQPTGPSTEPSLALGRNLFINNCLSCHRTQAISKPQTEASVGAALGRDPMKSGGLDTKFVGDKQKLGSLVLYINEEF
jgi:hypothetical protein